MNKEELNQLEKINIFLQSVSDEIIHDFKSVLSGDLGLIKEEFRDKIDYIDFGINEDGYTLFLHPMDSENNQVGYKKLLAKYPNGILRDNNLDLDTYDYDFDDDDEMDRLDEFYLQLKDNFIKWFSACWEKAGGMDAKYKFYLTPHDEGKSLDLNKKEWISHLE